MTAHAQRLRLRMFIEGVEVPIIAAQIACHPNSPIVATLQIPPLAEGTRIFPRSLVHVFFLDFYAQANPHVSGGATSATGGQTNPPSAYQQEVDDGLAWSASESDAPDFMNQHYKLLFVGEYAGFQWTKNQGNRSLVLQCIDLSNYWDYAYQWSNTDIFGPGVKALFSGGSTNLLTDFLVDNGTQVLQLMRRKSLLYPNLKGLLGGIIAVLESIGGTYFTPHAIKGQNIYFTLAELRLHITQMITAYEKDPTSSQLINASGYGDLFGRTLGDLGDQVSFRQAINALQGMIFHETFGQPCPYFVPGTYGATAGKIYKSISALPSGAPIVADAQQLISSMADRQDTLKDLAAGNISGTPNQLKFGINTGLTNDVNLCGTAIKDITASKTPEFDKLKTYFSSGRSYLQQAQTKIKAWGGIPPMSPSIYTAISGLIDKARAQFQRVLDSQIPIDLPANSSPARLNQQIFRPDVWFSAPPRCNVLFPDNYESLQYTRAFLAEPTRFLLKTNDEFFGEDELFDHFYFAPKAPTVTQTKIELQKLLKNELMDHELFTGILPIFEKMGELNIFAASSGTSQSKNDKIGVAQRSTNFLYFKHRFSARQMQVEAKFNPYIACGFPGLIIDRYVDAAVLQLHNQLLHTIGQPTRETRNLLGTHFLGNFTEVTHNIDQRQGKTSINIGYARQYEESVEFLGAIQSTQTVNQKQAGSAARISTWAALTQPPIGALGPNQGVITQVLDLTNAYAPGTVFPLYRGPRQQPDSAQIQVPVNQSKAASSYPAGVATWIGDPNQQVTFHPFELTEEIPRYKTQSVEVAAEDYIRPGWYGSCWKSDQIGQVYNQFFGIGAITDPTSITDSQGSSLGKPDTTSTAASANQQPGNPSTPVGPTGAVLSLPTGVSIAQAVEFLVASYSYVKQAETVNIDDYIMSYTWRPIASLVDMFGTKDLTLSSDGATVLSGYEGFHSRAFGPYDNLFGIVTPNIETVLGINRGEAAAQRADTRQRKQQAVLDYVAALQLSRAILG